MFFFHLLSNFPREVRISDQYCTTHRSLDRFLFFMGTFIPSTLLSFCPRLLHSCRGTLLRHHPEDVNEIFKNRISPASALSSFSSIFAVISAFPAGAFLRCWSPSAVSFYLRVDHYKAWKS